MNKDVKFIPTISDHIKAFSDCEVANYDFFENIIGSHINKLNNKKEAIIIERLKCIGVDYKEIINRRFKMLHKEIQGSVERIYYNDGSDNGKLLVTFILKDAFVSIDNSNEFKITLEYI